MSVIKRFVTAAGALCALFGGASCSAAPAAAVTAAPEKVLVVYYSWSGNTKVAAEAIAEITGGKLFAIAPKQAYPADYKACVEQAKTECREGATPELAAWPEDLEKYDVIFVGSPNWWGTMAPPVRTFLAAPALKGRTIVPFFTHGGGGMQNCERDVRALCAGSTVLAADTFYGKTVKVMKGKFATFVNERVRIVR